LGRHAIMPEKRGRLGGRCHQLHHDSESEGGEGVGNKKTPISTIGIEIRFRERKKEETGGLLSIKV